MAEAGPVAVPAAPGDAGDAVLLTPEALAAAGAERREALARYAARLRAVEDEVERFRAAAARDVPARCPGDVSSLLGRVVALATECPAVADANRRSACYADRDRANAQLGTCERRNRLHEERSEAARRAVAAHRADRLARFARELEREAREHRVEAVGHTDGQGDPGRNRTLSRGRAEAVAAFLAERGVDRGRLRVDGMGSALPVADNGTPAGRARNRRVEVVIYPTATA